MAEKQKFLERIRGNAEWKAIEGAYRYGQPVIYPSVYALIQKIHHADRDWLVIGVFFCLGLVATFIGYLRGRSRPQNTSASQTLVPAASSANDDTAIRFAEGWQKIDYLAAHERGMRWVTLLNDTQLELIETSRDLTSYLDSLGEYPECPEPKTTTSYIKHIISGPGSQWSTRFIAGYEKDFAPRISKLILNLEQYDGQRRDYLRNYKDSIVQMSDLWRLRELLWIEASHLSGVELRNQSER